MAKSQVYLGCSLKVLGYVKPRSKGMFLFIPPFLCATACMMCRTSAPLLSWQEDQSLSKATGRPSSPSLRCGGAVVANSHWPTRHRLRPVPSQQFGKGWLLRGCRTRPRGFVAWNPSLAKVLTGVNNLEVSHVLLGPFDKSLKVKMQGQCLNALTAP